MQFLKRYSSPLGITLLFCIVLILLSIPGTVFSHGVKFIDTDLNQSTGKQAYITTTMHFGSQEHMSTFPMQIGQWQGWDYDTATAKAELGADVMVLRGYETPQLYQPVLLRIVQARTDSSFHPPDICYLSQGYNIQEQDKDEVFVSPASWAEGSPNSLSVPFNLIAVFKGSQGNITERRVALYCYIRACCTNPSSQMISSGKIEASGEGGRDGVQLD